MELTTQLRNEAPAQVGAGALAAQKREETEIQSAIIIAQRFPRNEAQCFEKGLKSFERRSMAESATFSFPRGGKNVSGPTVDTARELARCWRNLWYGWRFVECTADTIRIRGFCHDLETNAHSESEDEFRPLIQRKDKNGCTQWVEPDERDLRELVCRRAAICERNAILHILPPDLVEEAQRVAAETLHKPKTGPAVLPRAEQIARMVAGFSDLGIEAAKLERHSGCKLADLTDKQITALREIYKAIRDGEAQPEEFFGEGPA